MTNREYISQKLGDFGVTEADFLDLMSKGIEPEDRYMGDQAFGEAYASLVAEIVLRPRATSIHENGFSMSWNVPDLGKYYLAICSRYGITPDPLICSEVNSIKDISDCW